MTRTTRRPALVLAVCGTLLVSGVMLGTARASDPTHLAQLLKTNSCPKCDLTDANLLGLGLHKADLREAILVGANLYNATLTEADFTTADLTDANLNAANLKGAKGVVFANAKTDARTICPDGTAGPCQ